MNEGFMVDMIYAVVLVMIAGLSGAAFALPMRFNRTWKWENTWFVFTLCSLGVFPWLLVLILVKHLPELLTSLSLHDVTPALLFGFLWGIAMATYGVALELLGISIAVPIVSGLTIITGTFTPILARHPEVLLQRPGIVMELSTVLLLGSLIQYRRAARMRESTRRYGQSSKGLILAVFTGVFGGMINVGFALGDRIAQRSRMLGNSASVSTYPVWAFVLAAGLVPNFVYCLYLIINRRTGRQFVAPGCPSDLLRSILMAVLWIMATVLYGISTTFLGKLGTSVGFLLYGGFTIFFANVLGQKAGEWADAPFPALKSLWIATGLALASVVILGMAR
jgi:hypothetical protein